MFPKLKKTFHFTHWHNLSGAYCKYDYRDGEELDLSANGTYSSVGTLISSYLNSQKKRTFLKELMSWHTKIVLERHIAKEPLGTPFFLYLSLQAIHDPHQASGKLKDAGGKPIEVSTLVYRSQSNTGDGTKT